MEEQICEKIHVGVGGLGLRNIRELVVKNAIQIIKSPILFNRILIPSYNGTNASLTKLASPSITKKESELKSEEKWHIKAPIRFSRYNIIVYLMSFIFQE